MERQFKPRRLVDVCKEWVQELRAEGETPEWRDRRLYSQRNELYYRGYQRLRQADLTNAWRILEPKPIHYTYNEFQFWCNVTSAKFVASRVDFRVNGIPEQDVEDKEMAASKLRNIGRYYDGRFWNRTKTLDASKQLQFTGYLIGYVPYSERAGVKAYKPITERVSIKLGKDVYRCADCGDVGEIDGSGTLQQEGAWAADSMSAGGTGGLSTLSGSGNGTGDYSSQPAFTETASTCAHCGSSNLAVTEIPSEEFEVETGQQEYDAGDVEPRLLSIYDVTWFAALGPERSSLLLWEEDHDEADLQAEYPGIKLPGGEAQNDGIQKKEQLRRFERNPQNKRKTLTRLWVEPRRYHDLEEKEEVQTVAGITFPAGTRWSQMFPHGMHVIMVGDLIVDIYAAVKNDDIVVMDYHDVPNGGMAQGVDAMCEPQRGMNTTMSLLNVWMRHNAAPRQRFNPELIDAADISGDPSRAIPINAANLGLRDGATIENAIYEQPGAQIPAGVFGLKDELRGSIQFAANATEFAEGMPGYDSPTFGAAKLGTNLSQSISGVVLGKFADFRVGMVKRTLKKLRAYCWDERTVEFAGKYGAAELLTLSGQEIPDSFEIEAVPNSWLPRTAEQRQQNLQGLLLATGGWAGLLAMPPEMVAELCETFDVQLDINLMPIAIRTVRLRLKQMEAALPALLLVNQQLNAMGAPPVQAEVDPMTGQPGLAPLSVGQQLVEVLQPPFNPREKGCGEAAEYISTWFTTDEGLNAKLDLIEAMGALQDLYIQAAELQAVVRAGVEMAGQPMPMLDAQNADGAPPSQKQKQPAKPQMGALAQTGG